MDFFPMATKYVFHIKITNLDVNLTMDYVGASHHKYRKMQCHAPLHTHLARALKVQHSHQVNKKKNCQNLKAILRLRIDLHVS